MNRFAPSEFLVFVNFPARQRMGPDEAPEWCGRQDVEGIREGFANVDASQMTLSASCPGSRK